MKQNKRLDVIDLSYYIIFHLQKHDFTVSIFDLQDILVSLQERYIEKYQQQLFYGIINIGRFGPEIKEVQDEFIYCGSYPIFIRNPMERCKKIFSLKHQINSAQLKELNTMLAEMTIKTTLSMFEFDGPKIMQKRK